MIAALLLSALMVGSDTIPWEAVGPKPAQPLVYPEFEDNKPEDVIRHFLYYPNPKRMTVFTIIVGASEQEKQHWREVSMNTNLGDYQHSVTVFIPEGYRLFDREIYSRAVILPWEEPRDAGRWFIQKIGDKLYFSY